MTAVFLASQASTDNEELLQFPLELCSDSLSAHPFPPAKGWLIKSGKCKHNRSF